MGLIADILRYEEQRRNVPNRKRSKLEETETREIEEKLIELQQQHQSEELWQQSDVIEQTDALKDSLKDKNYIYMIPQAELEELERVLKKAKLRLDQEQEREKEKERIRQDMLRQQEEQRKRDEELRKELINKQEREEQERKRKEEELRQEQLHKEQQEEEERVKAEKELRKEQERKKQEEKKVIFTQYTLQHKIVLQWGSEKTRVVDCFGDKRLVDYQEFYSEFLSVNKTWENRVLKMGEFDKHVQDLGAAKIVFDWISLNIPKAKNQFEGAIIQYDEIKDLCLRLDSKKEEDLLDEGYPNSVILRELLRGNRKQDEYSILNFTSACTGFGLDEAKKELEKLLLRWPEALGVAEEVRVLKNKAALLPLVSGAAVIPWSITLKASDVTKELPCACGNEMRIAKDIVSGATGPTTFKVAGRTVYHSSAGSGSVSGNSMGTAFWIIRDDQAREIIAMGKHDPLSSENDQYSIEWHAPGVKVPYKDENGRMLVNLSSTDKYLG
jgi:hypothetical protein